MFSLENKLANLLRKAHVSTKKRFIQKGVDFKGKDKYLFAMSDCSLKFRVLDPDSEEVTKKNGTPYLKKT